MAPRGRYGSYLCVEDKGTEDKYGTALCAERRPSYSG